MINHWTHQDTLVSLSSGATANETQQQSSDSWYDKRNSSSKISEKAFARWAGLYIQYNKEKQTSNFCNSSLDPSQQRLSKEKHYRQSQYIRLIACGQHAATYRHEENPWLLTVVYTTSPFITWWSWAWHMCKSSSSAWNWKPLQRKLTCRSCAWRLLSDCILYGIHLCLIQKQSS